MTAGRSNLCHYTAAKAADRARDGVMSAGSQWMNRKKQYRIHGSRLSVIISYYPHSHYNLGVADIGGRTRLFMLRKPGGAEWGVGAFLRR